VEISLISRGLHKGKLVVRYTDTDKFGNRTSKVELAPNTPAGRKKLENFIKNRPKLGEAQRVVFTTAQLEKIKKLKLKGLTEKQIVEQANIPKLKSTTPLKRLDLPSREDVVYKPREDKVRELAKTGKYTKSEIKNKIKRLFKVNIADRRLDPILKNYKIPTGLGSQKLKEKFSLKTKYLKNYTLEDLDRDIRAGKTRVEIAEDLLEKNKDYYKTLNTPRGVRTEITGALASRIAKNPELGKIEKTFLKKTLRENRAALRDVREFINKNKEAYRKVYASNKIGAVANFKEKVLDYISQKYPKLLKRAEGGRNLLSGQRIFTAYELLGRDISQKGDYGRDVGLNRDIRKALGIPERPRAGEGASKDRLTREYNKRTTQLLKLAQEKGLVPKIDPITGNPINSEAAYYRYVDRTQIDPIRNLFGRKYNFGQEHVGGIARSSVINDPKGLTQITAMDPYQNRFVKGSQFDTKTISQLKLAKGATGEKAKEYIDIQNKILDEADKKFGLDQTRQKIVGDEIRTIYPKSSLDDSFLKKAQRAIKSFIATGRDKEPAFKQIDPFLQETIKTVKKVGDFNPASNRLLSKALRRTGVAGLVAMLGVGMLGGEVEASEITPDKVVEPQENLKYNSTLGSIVNTKTEEPADQLQVWEWLKENPVKTVAGTSIGFSAQEIPGAYKKARELGRGRTRSALGITGALKPVLTTFGTPAMTALFEAPFAAKRLEEGQTMTDVLTDPFGPALGLSLMEPLSKRAGVIRDAPTRTMGQGLKNYFNLQNVGTARPGVTSKILRMGMSPRMIAGASRFLGLPGLALSLGLTGYDAYKNYQNQEGMIYNFFNRDE
jgi:DNA-binding MarR family transcriptional regulator